MRIKLLLALAAYFLTSLFAQAQPLKLAHQWPQGDSRDDGARLFVKEVQKQDPSIKFRIYPGGSLISNPIKQIDAIQDGSLDLAVFPLVYNVGQAPELSITILPGIVQNIEDAGRLKGTEYERLLQEAAGRQGYRILTWWWTEGGMANKIRPIGMPDTVKGLKFRGADRTIDTMLKAAGASVFAMPSTELYSALQNGVLDGLMTSYDTFLSMRLYEQTQYATLGGDYTIFIVMQPLVISLKAWNKLTDKQKQIFTDAANATIPSFNSGQEKIKAEAVKKFTQAGAEVRALTKDEYQAWFELAKETAWPEYAATNEASKALLAAAQAATK